MNWDFTNDSRVEIVDSVTIQGYRFSDGWARDQHIYFRTRFSKPFTSVQIDTTAIIKDGKHIGTAAIARFDFNTKKGEQIIVSTAISGVSMQGAERNLSAEVPDNDFDKYRNAIRDNWNRQLSKIKVESSNNDDKVNFYTALYHSMIAPTIYSDVDGAYYGPDKQIHQTNGWVNYSTFSLWDTFRAAHPLFTYTEPERANDMVKSFLAFYEQNGRLPVWNFYGSETDMMIGYHAVPVIVDAYLKGIGNFDPEKALEACVATANIDDYRGIGIYKNQDMYLTISQIATIPKTGRCLKHWNMHMTIIALPRWLKRWVGKRSPKNFTNVLKTIKPIQSRYFFHAATR